MLLFRQERTKKAGRVRHRRKFLAEEVAARAGRIVLFTAHKSDDLVEVSSLARLKLPDLPEASRGAWCVF